jgi:2-iminobutanoate/2-iminopropanoate deaminase
VRYINPSTGVARPQGSYSHIAIGSGSEIVGLAGQVSLDSDGGLVGEGDVASQTSQTLRNLSRLLAELDLAWSSILSMRTYIVGTEHLPGFRSVASAFFADAFGDGLPPPNTLVVVSALARPEFLVEIEALAVRP